MTAIPRRTRAADIVITSLEFHSAHDAAGSWDSPYTLVVPNPILLLSGPVAAGKTTVARELVRLWPAPVVYIEGDVFWSFYAKGAQGSSPKRFKTIMASMIAAAVPFAATGSDVIVDFTMPPWFLETAQRVASVRDVPLDYVVFRPSEAACRARGASREAGRIEDYSRYVDLYRDFDALPDHCIADDASSAAEIAARILDGLGRGAYRLSAT